MSGGEEVWLVFPESRWIIVTTQNKRLVFVSGEVVSTQTVLPGFSVAVDKLLEVAIAPGRSLLISCCLN
jgi:hypothetical protein